MKLKLAMACLLIGASSCALAAPNSPSAPAFTEKYLKAVPFKQLATQKVRRATVAANCTVIASMHELQSNTPATRSVQWSQTFKKLALETVDLVAQIKQLTREQDQSAEMSDFLVWTEVLDSDSASPSMYAKAFLAAQPDDYCFRVNSTNE